MSNSKSKTRRKKMADDRVLINQGHHRNKPFLVRFNAQGQWRPTLPKDIIGALENVYLNGYYDPKKRKIEFMPAGAFYEGSE